MNFISCADGALIVSVTNTTNQKLGKLASAVAREYATPWSSAVRTFRLCISDENLFVVLLGVKFVMAPSDLQAGPCGHPGAVPLTGGGMFKDQVVIVTGGTEGIGAVIVERMAREGARVVTVSRSSTGSQFVAGLAEQGMEVSWIQLDVANAKSCVELVNETIGRYGRLDVLVNNAGNRPATLQRKIEALTDMDLTYALETHLHGPFNLSVAAWPYMTAQHYGRILNFCSGHIFGTARDYGIIPFGIAKAGIIGLTKLLAAPGAQCGIAVNALFPAALDSNWNRVDWAALSVQDEQDITDICSKMSLWPFIRWACSKNVTCNGEMFSICNETLTNVFIADSENYLYTDFADVGECVKTAMSASTYYRPRSIGNFFGKHLGRQRSNRLHQILSSFDRTTRI